MIFGWLGLSEEIYDTLNGIKKGRVKPSMKTYN